MINGSWLVLIPPFLVVVCALVTRRVIFSFSVGVISSVLLLCKTDIKCAAHLTATRFLESSGLNKFGSWHDFWSNWNFFIFLFLILLGVLITLMRDSGAADAFAHIIGRRVKSKEATQKASLVLSLVFFLDDYFSVLTVGSVMRALAHLHKISAVKMAFLVTGMATPIVILSPISSWIGEIILQLKVAGISPHATLDGEPYFVFLRSIPFIFYAIFMIINVWYIVIRNISYGPMYYDEHHKLAHVRPYHERPFDKDHASILDFLIPVGSLIVSVLFGFLYTGDFHWFGGSNSFIEAIKNTKPHLALFFGGLTSSIISFLYFLIRKKITLKQAHIIIKNGVLLMLPSILMLIVAWAFGGMLREDLHTGDYIASRFIGFMNVTFLPLLCFIITGLTSCIIGSAWATIGIMLPLVVPMIEALLQIPAGTSVEAVPLLFPVIGATLSGAIMGTTVSIIADNPIMTAASTGANHYEHIKTMSWYAVPVICATALAYAIIGIGMNWMSLPIVWAIAFSAGIIVLICLLELFARLFHHRKTLG